jgi:hypothetical protein
MLETRPRRILLRPVVPAGFALLALAAAPFAQGADPSKDAMKYGSPPSLPAGQTVESMWPAPTAEDWAKPCLIPWQRSFDDALRVAQATQKPILVCVNMDGEPASEHFAGKRYRDPETARLLEPYVCIAASVYRHTPRDFDEEGKRVVCPRFGSMTCGEHIAAETELYEKYFEGKRIAPRHLLLELDGSKSYDVYYSWDVATVFTAYKEGAKNRPPPKPNVKNDLPLAERTTSADLVDRVAVETAYQRGTHEERRTLLTATLKAHEVDQVDLLRLAIFGLDVELARLARAALAKCETEAAVDLIAEALKQPMDPAERADLVAAAARLAEKFPRARTLVAVQQGLGSNSKLVDVADWARAQGEYRSTAGASYEPAARVELRAAAAEARPEDAEAQLGLAESLLARGQDPTTERRFAALMLEDARNMALEAEKLGAKGWRLDAVLAVTQAAHGERDAALARAQAAIEGGMPRPSTDAEGVQERTAVQVLALFAQARQQAIAKAYRERTTWPPEWLADVHAAYAVLARHPLGTDANVADCYDFLRWLGATMRANAALDEGLARFPDSWMLHERLRTRALWEKGPDGLEATYAALLAKPDASGDLGWFAGYASLVAAEQQRRAKEPEKSAAAYGRAIAFYEHDAELHPDHRASADHYVALALAGRARLAFERGEPENATQELLAALKRSPEAAAALDGLGIAPVETARVLITALEHGEKAALAQAIQAQLDALDPRYLELPTFERGLTRPGSDTGPTRPRGR